MRESNLSTLLQVARAAGLGHQLELDLGIDYAPKIVRDHGLQEAHTNPLVSAKRGASFRVPASQAWVYPGSAQKTEKIVRQAELFSNWSSSDSR